MLDPDELYETVEINVPPTWGVGGDNSLLIQNICKGVVNTWKTGMVLPPHLPSTPVLPSGIAHTHTMTFTPVAITAQLASMGHSPQAQAFYALLGTQIASYMSMVVFPPGELPFSAIPHIHTPIFQPASTLIGMLNSTPLSGGGTLDFNNALGLSIYSELSEKANVVIDAFRIPPPASAHILV